MAAASTGSVGRAARHHVRTGTRQAHHPRRAMRQARAAERLLAHVNGPRCGPNCPKR